MKLQIEITGPVITPAGEMYKNKLVNAEFTLKCWPEGADKKTIEPVIKDRKFSCKQKTVIDGKVLADLPETITGRAEKEISNKIKEIISAYEYAKEIEAEPKITKMASDIKGLLNG